MDTQNTPIHIKLWHHDFWRLCFANLLLMASVYMLFVAVPHYMLLAGFQPFEVGSVLGVYGLGIFALGGFCAYWVQRYRRNRVCQYAIAGVVVCIALLYYLEVFLDIRIDYWMLLATRFLMGACLGVAQITLSSTLIIDTCESFQRTEANYITSWFSRFAIAIGPIVSILSIRYLGFKLTFPVAAALALGSLVLVSLAKFPFKAPAEHMPLFSLDRFFLPQGLPLFVNIVVIMAVVGMVMSCPHSMGYYVMAFSGLVIAIIAEKYVFADADLKSEVLTGLVLLVAALLVSQAQQQAAQEFVSPTMLGFSIGIMGSRFLLFYIKLAKHCQRGTSVSSFFLAWELGLSLGLGGGFLLLNGQDLRALTHAEPILDMIPMPVMVFGLVVSLSSLLVYNFLVHPWYMRHRNR